MNGDERRSAAAKAALRTRMRALLRRLPPEQRETDAARLRARLQSQPFFRRATSVLFFAPLPHEIDLWPLLAEALTAGKSAALPAFDTASQSYCARRVRNPAGELVIGKFGIREPGPDCTVLVLSRLDLVLVPGVAFDGRGQRLGRGQGFYDLLLREVRGVKCGVAFDEQVVEAVPAECRDVGMNFIVTPTACRECG